MLELAFEMNPKLIIMENVQGLLKSPLLGTLTARLKACGYAVSVYLLNGDRFTATSRPRVFILGSQIGEELLHGLASRMRKLPRLRIKDQFECTSLWHPVRPSGHGPNGQHCIIPASSTYPCIDTKCLLRPPPNYRGHPLDHEDGLGGTSYPSAKTILELLGFPRDYLTVGEIEQPNCRCNICNGHRSSQAAQMLGRSWGPHMAMEIGHALLGPLTRAKLQEQSPRSRVHSLKAKIHGMANSAPSGLEQLDYAAAQMRATPVLRGTEAAWFAHVKDIYNFQALEMFRTPDFEQHKVMLRRPPRYPIAGPPARACISESVLGSYVSQEEARRQCDLRDYVALEKYSVDDVVRGKHTSDISHKSIDALHRTYGAVFAKHSLELPKTVLNEDKTPAVVTFTFKPDARPVQCRPPDLPRGSARRKILEHFRIEMERRKLVVKFNESRWASRPHLVAKYAEDAVRGGIPNDIRFTGDLKAVNAQCDKVSPVCGNVENELERAMGHNWYIKADSMKAYWSFLVDAESMEASTIWLPGETGKWEKYAFTRLQMGSTNASTSMNSHYYRISGKCMDRETYSQLMDDWVIWGSTQADCLQNYETFLRMCLEYQITLKPKKVHLLLKKVTYYGWDIDRNGRSPTARNLDPIRRMQIPNSIEETRSMIGYFQTYRKFIKTTAPDATTGVMRLFRYEEIVEPISVKVLRDTSRGIKFAQRWREPQQKAYDLIKGLLLAGVHLCSPLSDRPYNFSSDMSDWGYGITLYQLADDGSRRCIMEWNVPWGWQESQFPAVVKEALAWLQGMQNCFPMVRHSAFPFYTYTDSLPVSWIRKGSGKRGMSMFKLAYFDEIDWRVMYLPGRRNVVADALSRPPMIGPRQPATKGIELMVIGMLDMLPGHLSESKHIFVSAGKDDEIVANIVRRWRTKPGKTQTGSVQRVSRNCQLKDKTGKNVTACTNYDLAIVVPTVEFGPLACADLLKAGKPFAVLVDSTLISTIAEQITGKHDPEVQKLLEDTSRKIYSHAQYTFVLGGFPHTKIHRQHKSRSTGASNKYDVTRALHISRNLPNNLHFKALSQQKAQKPIKPAILQWRSELLPTSTWKMYFTFDINGKRYVNADAADHCARQYSARIYTGSAKLTMHLPGIGDPQDPTDSVQPFSKWIPQQTEEAALLSKQDAFHIHKRATDGLLLYRRHDDFGRAFVPKSQRERITKLTHNRMFHMGHRKVYSHLKRWYWWPKMMAEVEEFLKPCHTCNLAKGTRSMAHKLWRSTPMGMPRSTWGFDLKEMVPAKDGQNQIGVAVDQSTHLCVLFASKTRKAPALCQLLLDRVITQHGMPLVWRTDHAQELISNYMDRFWKPYGTVVTTTKSYHPEGNAQAERLMRYLNACFRSLSDKQYAVWPTYLSSMEAAWNSHVVSTIECTPFKAHYGVPMRTPESLLTSPGNLPEASEMNDHAIRAVQASAKAWSNLANNTATWHKERTRNRLNASGTAKNFDVGDKVMIYVPPSQGEVKRRKRKAKHLCWYRGPCTITAKSGTCFSVKHDESGKIFERTLQNIATYKAGKVAVDAAPFNATIAPPPIPNLSPTAAVSPASTDSYAIGDIIAAKDALADNVYWIQKVVAVTHDEIRTHIYGTNGRKLLSAAFRPLYTTETGEHYMFKPLKATSKSPESKPWIHRLQTHWLPGLVVARNLKLKTGKTTIGRLTKSSCDRLDTLKGSLSHALA